MFDRIRSRITKLKSKIKKIISKKVDNELYYVGGSENLPAPLSKEEESKILAEIEAGDNSKRELLIVHNLRLVVYIARKFENTGINIEDLISIGTVGLIKAVNTFCPEKKIKLATYASRCIENEILMYLRKTSNRKNEISIDEPLNVDWDGNELLLSDILGSDADEVCKNIEKEAEKTILMQIVEKLPQREKDIMIMRFGLYNTKEYTQKQVADMLGISQSYISRLEKRIIINIKREIEKVS